MVVVGGVVVGVVVVGVVVGGGVVVGVVVVGVVVVGGVVVGVVVPLPQPVITTNVTKTIATNRTKALFFKSLLLSSLAMVFS